MLMSGDVRVRVGGILFREGKLLLIAHKKDGEIYWLLPGGGVNFGESLEEALVREFREELNISIKTDQLVMVYDSIDPDGERHIVNICFNCTHESGEYQIGGEERLYNYDFFDIGDLSELPMYPPINDALRATS